MLQLRQNFTVNHTTHRFVAHSAVIMGTEQVSDIVTLLPSANVTTMPVPKMMVNWYFLTNFAATNLWLAPL